MEKQKAQPVSCAFPFPTYGLVLLRSRVAGVGITLAVGCFALRVALHAAALGDHVHLRDSERLIGVVGRLVGTGTRTRARTSARARVGRWQIAAGVGRRAGT